MSDKDVLMSDKNEFVLMSDNPTYSYQVDLSNTYVLEMYLSTQEILLIQKLKELITLIDHAFSPIVILLI